MPGLALFNYGAPVTPWLGVNQATGQEKYTQVSYAMDDAPARTIDDKAPFHLCMVKELGQTLRNFT